MKPSATAYPRRMPQAVWAVALVAAALRALPFLAVRYGTPPRGAVYLPIGYIPKDWLQYAAMVRQPLALGHPFLFNPFTTEPQDGRFVLLFHQLLGVVHALTGMDVFWLLELARVPLLLLFFAALWRFTGRVLRDERERVTACALVAFSGGLEQLALPLVHRVLPAATAAAIEQDLWHLYGWSTFASFYNPLWVAALALLLWSVPPLLQPGGPASWRDRLRAASGLLLLAFTHVYSALTLLAIVAGVLLVEAALVPAQARQRLRGTAIALLPALLVWSLVTRWQLGDAVFRESSHGLLGSQAPPVFWYPLTFGAVAWFALRGFRRWAAEDHPWRFAVAGWLVGVTLLASSTLLNGYHFVFALHLPLAVVAAPGLLAWWSGRSPGAGRTALASVVAVALGVGTLLVTVRSIAEARETSALPLSVVPVLADLAATPATNVLAPPELGNVIPALSPHRVWVGHWFLTPGYSLRGRWYELLLAQPERQASNLRHLIDANRFGAVVVPAGIVPRLAPAFAGLRIAVHRCGHWSVVHVS